MELVQLDYLTIGQKETDRSINILVITDHFMKYGPLVCPYTCQVTLKLVKN